MVPAAAAPAAGVAQAERDEKAAPGLAHARRQGALAARHEPHLFEGGCGALKPASAEPAKQFLDPMGDEHPAQACAQDEQSGVLLPSAGHDHPFRATLPSAAAA